MIEPKKQIHPIVRAMVSGTAFIIASLLVNFVLPAWAVSFPVGSLFVVDLGPITPWVGILVTLGIWWDARQAKKVSMEVKTDLGTVKEDVKLLERNTNSISSRNEEIARRLGISEGEEKQKLVGAETAATLAQGQSEGRDNERAAAAVRSGPSAADGKQPLPVTDERATAVAESTAEAVKATAEAAKLTAEATKSTAEATGRLADATGKIADAGNPATDRKK